MTLSSAQILASIPQWVKEANATSLAAHAEHTDKEVRKQVRKAMHQLRARGVAVPEGQRQSWTFSDQSLNHLRGETQDRAFVDPTSVPGIVHIYVLQADEEYGGSIEVARLDSSDRVLGFEVYGQTDGQRARVLKQWDRGIAGRAVPVQWARQRILWAREATLAQGFSVPSSLDSALLRLGQVPTARPTSFVTPLLADIEQAPVSTEEELLSRIGAIMWPRLFAVEAIMNKVGANLPERTGEDVPPPQRRLDFRAAVTAAIAGDPVVRATLAGPVANIFEDAAVAAWNAGSDAWAKRLLNEADKLRRDETPEASALGIVAVEVQLVAAQRAWQEDQARQQA